MSFSTIDLYRTLDSLAKTYAKQIYEILSSSCYSLAIAGVTLWIIWEIIMKGFIKASLNIHDSLKAFLVFSLIATVLSSGNIYWDYFYTPIYETTTQLAQVIITAGGKGQGGGIEDLLRTVESEVGRIFKLLEVINNDASWYQVPTFIGGLILVVPFMFVWGLFLAYILECVFKLLAVTAIAPLLILCLAFNATRGFATAAARVVLNGALTLILAAVAMGFTLAALKQAMKSVPINAQGVMAGAANWVYGENYWYLLLIGFISILFHLKASQIASNIVGSTDGPGAAGAVVGAGMAAMHAAKSYSARGISGAYGGAKSVYSKYSNRPTSYTSNYTLDEKL